MSTSPSTKSVVNKRSKKRTSSGSKENRASNRVTSVEDDKVSLTKSASSPGLTGPEKTKEVALNDPAIVAAGRPRRQPLNKSTSITNMDRNSVGTDASKSDGVKSRVNRTPKATTATSDKSSPETSPKHNRNIRKRKAGNQTKSASKTNTASNEGDESMASTTKLTPRKERGTQSYPAATPPRFQASKGKRDNAVNKANESIDSDSSQPDDKARSVRFQTESPPEAPTVQMSKQASTKSSEVKALSQEVLAQQAALHDAAALLAQSTMPNFASPLYANLLTTNLAQQQLATAQVLANLRASVEGFKPMKNFEPASAYDASRVPCLADREDVNTTTNIYVNNLPSHTTDDDLLRLGACFGPVKSHKAIINQETGLCKGYGFVMYEHALDAETALQQLPLHGLTTSWAKESFSTKLRKLSDNSSTNVYVSNLPMEMTPHQLEQLFTPHVVVSLRILLDDNGDSRGVGFVRLRDRDTAQECIDKLHGKILSGQTTPLQARFADSEAQKRLKQSITQTSPVFNQKPIINSKPSNGLLDNTGLADSMCLASLQGLHNWAGFGTPQTNSNGSFPVMSPQLGMTSPGLNYTQWSPSMAANAAANWNLLASDVYGNSLLGAANSAIHGLNYANSLYSPSSIATSMNSPFAQMSNKSLSPLSFTSTPLTSTSPMLGKGDQGSRPGSTRIKPTYLPPDVHQQHAKALLEAQSGLAFDSPQAEAFGLSQLLLANNHENDHSHLQPQQLNKEVSPYSSAHSYVNLSQGQIDAVGNALGMTGMTASRVESLPATANSKSRTNQISKSSTISHPFTPASISKTGAGDGKAPFNTTTTSVTLSPIRFSLSKDPENPIAVEALTQEVSDISPDEMKQPVRTSTPMPAGMNDKTSIPASTGIQMQESVTEEGDSLVIDSGTSSSVGKFSLPRVEAKQEVVTLSKSDSGKVLDQNCLSKSQEDQMDQKLNASSALQVSALPIEESA